MSTMTTTIEFKKKSNHREINKVALKKNIDDFIGESALLFDVVECKCFIVVDRTCDEIPILCKYTISINCHCNKNSCYLVIFHVPAKKLWFGKDSIVELARNMQVAERLGKKIKSKQLQSHENTSKKTLKIYN